MIALYLTAVNDEKRALAIRAVKAALAAAGMEPMDAFTEAERAVMHVLQRQEPCGLIVETPPDPEPGQVAVTASQVYAAAEAFEVAVGDTECAEAYTVDENGTEGRRIPAATPATPEAPASDARAITQEDADRAKGKRSIPIGSGDAGSPPKHGDNESIARAFLRDVPDDFTPSREASATTTLLMGLAEGNAQTAFIYCKRFAHVTGHPELWVEVAHCLGDAYGFKVAQL